MKVEGFKIKILFTVAIILLPLLVWPQSKLDSILAIATQQIYENPDSAIEMANEFLADHQISTEKRVRIILLISTAYSSKRDYEKSLEYALSALDFLPKLKDDKLKINLYNRIGGQYQELKIYDKAIYYLDQALELIKRFPNDEAKFRNLGVNNMLRGYVYREQMSCEIALSYFEKALEDFERSNHSSGINANISISYYNRGNCLLTLEKIDEAKNSFIESINYGKKADAISLIAFAQKGLARVYTIQKEYEKAIALLLEALQNSENVGDKVLNRAVYDALATNYLSTGDFKKYSYYQNKSMDVHKQLTQVERKVVDDSISDLVKVNSEEIKTIESRKNTLQIIFITLIILGIFLTARQIFISEKIMTSYKKRLKF